jgi:hypothetical protein
MQPGKWLGSTSREFPKSGPLFNPKPAATANGIAENTVAAGSGLNDLKLK